VVAFNRGALPEIAGDAALLIDEPTAAALADGIARALTDSALRDDLRIRGPKRAEMFRCRETAARTWDVLAEVAAA
jgi:glycosyltransferase involved in cell wall biosynthesis